MKSIATLLIATLLAAPAFAQEKTKTKAKPKDGKKKADAKTKKKKPAPLPFKTLKENASYAIGLNMGSRIVQRVLPQLRFADVDRKKLALAMKFNKKTIDSIKNDGIPVDEKVLQQAFQDALSGAKEKMTREQMIAVFEEVNKLAVAKKKKIDAEKKKKREAYLAKNKKKIGVITTKSGLQYEILKKGTGKKPTAADTVTVHYVGKLTDGTVFDSSRKRGIPATFGVRGVIPGWTEALQLMKVGAKWKLVIPPELGYGARGSRTGAIGPNEILVFEVELIDVKSPKKEKKQ